MRLGWAAREEEVEYDERLRRRQYDDDDGDNDMEEEPVSSVVFLDVGSANVGFWLATLNVG